ncbi:MAG: hypothetical protein WD379_04885 [Dehalococcoidia bacterium]
MVVLWDVLEAAWIFPDWPVIVQLALATLILAGAGFLPGIVAPSERVAPWCLLAGMASFVVAVPTIFTVGVLFWAAGEVLWGYALGAAVGSVVRDRVKGRQLKA